MYIGFVVVVVMVILIVVIIIYFFIVVLNWFILFVNLLLYVGYLNGVYWCICYYGINEVCYIIKRN